MPALRGKTPAHIRNLLDQLDETPEDLALRLVIADAFEEVGDTDSADCLRWTARKEILADFYAGCVYSWYLRNGKANVDDRDLCSLLPTQLFQELSSWMTELSYPDIGTSPTRWKDYETRRASEYALRVAWRKARRKGWVPE